MKIFIASPVYRQVEFKHYTSMMRLMMAINDLEDVELNFGMVPGDADVARARNVAAAHFLKSDADVMLTIDADIVFSPTDAIKLCREAVELNAAVGALYMVRSIKDRQPAPLIEVDQEIDFHTAAEPVPVKYLATGFMAVARPVMETIGAALPTYMQTTPLPFQPFYGQMALEHETEGYLYLSEDFAFCHRVHEHGFGVWLDPGIRLGHLGQYEYKLEDFVTEFPEPMPIRITQRDGQCEVEGFPNLMSEATPRGASDTEG